MQASNTHGKKWLEGIVTKQDLKHEMHLKKRRKIWELAGKLKCWHPDVKTAMHVFIKNKIQV